jgi:hypothetical protein
LAIYFILVTFKLKWASLVWNSLTSTDANKQERIKLAAFYCNRYFHFDHHSYVNALAIDYLKLHTCVRGGMSPWCTISYWFVNSALSYWKLLVL